MSIKYFLVILLMALTVTSFATSNHLRNNVLSHFDKDSVLLSKIYRLKEVQERETYLKKLTKGKGHISLVINGRPTKANPFYFIQVGYDNSLRFEVYFNFKINKYDFQKGDVESCLYIMNENSVYLPLSKWRLQNPQTP